MLAWCERHGVDYVVGIARNKRLARLAAPYLDQAEADYQRTGQKQRYFHELRYGARTWDRRRRIILKAEVTRQGRNPRFVVTNLGQSGPYLYDRLSTVPAARWRTASRVRRETGGE
jgi:hypothetical protein